jgi:hypothetical protein
VRFARRVLLAAVVAGALASASGAFDQRDVAFVTIVGHGSVKSLPAGIDCPKKSCRGIFVRGTHLRLVAVAAAGWRFTGFRSKWCNAGGKNCVFDLVSPHDCIGGACPVGAFGVRAIFVRTDE